MSEMIERVAKRTCDFQYGLGSYDAHSHLRDHFHAMARVAIETMREPTEAMLVAGLEHEGTDLASEYRAMIDAASRG